MIRSLTAILAAAPLAWLAVAPVHAAPPTNDNFTSSLVANPAPGVPVVWTASTVEATVEVGEPQPDCVGLGKTVWYKIPASDHDRVIAVDTKGSDFDTVVAVYRVTPGAGIAGLQQVDCADDSFVATADPVRQGRAAFRAVAGVKYRIQVGGCCSPDAPDSGSLKVKVTEVTAPVNDDPAGAIAVTSLPTTLTGTTRNATTFPGGNPPPPDPEPRDCFGSIYGHTVWYYLKFPVDTIVTVDTTGSDFDTVLAVYEKTGPDFGGLTFLDCNDDHDPDGIALESQVTFLAEAGKKYRIQVGGFAGDNGNLSISFSEGAPASAAPAGPVEPVTKKKK